MRIIFHKQFQKMYQKLPENIKHRFKERRDLFIKDAFHPFLNNHKLNGEYEGYRSINIGGDIRAVYEPIDNETAHFIFIGTHSELYS